MGAIKFERDGQDYLREEDGTEHPYEQPNPTTFEPDSEKITRLETQNTELLQRLKASEGAILAIMDLL